MTDDELRRDAVVVPVALALVRAAVVRRDRGSRCLLAAIARQAGELADNLVGDDRPGEGYLAKAGRLTGARHQAEEIIKHEHGPLASDDENGDEEAHRDEDNGPIPAGERPMVVSRDHPSWAEVDAEQRERIHDPGDGLATLLIGQANAPPNLSGRRGVASSNRSPTRPARPGAACPWCGRQGSSNRFKGLPRPPCPGSRRWPGTSRTDR